MESPLLSATSLKDFDSPHYVVLSSRKHLAFEHTCSKSPTPPEPVPVNKDILIPQLPKSVNGRMVCWEANDEVPYSAVEIDLKEKKVYRRAVPWCMTCGNATMVLAWSRRHQQWSARAKHA